LGPNYESRNAQISHYWSQDFFFLTPTPSLKESLISMATRGQDTMKLEIQTEDLTNEMLPEKNTIVINHGSFNCSTRH